MDIKNNQKNKLKRILLLREKGLTFEQIAKIFGVKMNTVYMWYKRLKEKFKDEIDCNNITNIQTEEIREIEKFKELLNYRKKLMSWKEIAEIKKITEHSVLRNFGNYKKRHLKKIKPEDYHAQVICKKCGKKFEINLFSPNKSFNFCSKKCEKNYFSRKVKNKEKKELERFEKFIKIKELRLEQKMAWKNIELYFKKDPYKRNCERFYNRHKKKYL